MPSFPFECVACGGSSRGAAVDVAEMMLGTRDRFRYETCAGCGSLQLVEPPADMARYYPRTEYVPFTGAGRRPGLRRVLALRDRASYRGHGPAHWIFARFGILEPGIVAVGHYSLPPETRLLDVGCGGGSLVSGLARNGWTRLTGLDPYARPELLAPARFVAADLTGITSEPFDLIVFNHSLEHLFDPRAALAKARELLADGGHVLVRIPIAADAWRRYGPHWFQIDAPRHLFVPTVAGIEQLVARAGLRIADVQFDSDEGQYRVSEQYARGISLRERPYPTSVDLVRRVVAPAVRRQRAAARRANEARTGDQASFLLRPSAG
jgi:SAM-dependent methyltransferase